MSYHKIDNKKDIRIQWQNYSEIRAIICKKITFFLWAKTEGGSERF